MIPPFIIAAGRGIVWLYRALKGNCPGCNESLRGQVTIIARLEWCAECYLERHPERKS